MTDETIEHMAAVVEQKGTDAFWQLPVEDLLPERLRAEAPRLRKQLETMDVWFDSGTSWAGCVEGNHGLAFPADLYLEVRPAGPHFASSPTMDSDDLPGRNVRRVIAPHASLVYSQFVTMRRRCSLFQQAGAAVFHVSRVQNACELYAAP
jgi:hypothetical protein